MMKFNEFKGISTKKQNRLKKQKKEDLALVRKKKEILKKMNTFVNGSSAFSKDYGSTFEKSNKI